MLISNCLLCISLKYLTYNVVKIQLIIHVPSPPTSSSWYIIGMLSKCLNSTELTELPSFWLLQFKTLASPSIPSCLLANQIPESIHSFPEISLSSVPSSSLLRMFLSKHFLLIELLHSFATSLPIFQQIFWKHLPRARHKIQQESKIVCTLRA